MDPGKNLPQVVGKDIFPKLRLAVPAHWQVLCLWGPQQPAVQFLHVLLAGPLGAGGGGLRACWLPTALLGFFLKWKLDYLELHRWGIQELTAALFQLEEVCYLLVMFLKMLLHMLLS
jgi:hypothetical protein